MTGITFTAYWTQGGMITITVTKDGAGVTGLENSFMLQNGDAQFRLPMSSQSAGVYQFDPSNGALPTGTMTLLLTSDTYSVPAGKATFTYDGANPVSIVLDHYTVSVKTDDHIASAGFKKGNQQFTQLILPDDMEIALEARPETGYYFERYTALGVAPKWDPAKQSQTITIRGKVEITAHGAPNVYTVVYHVNGGEGAMQNQDMVWDEPQRLLTCRLSRAHYHFFCWNTKPDGSGTKYWDRQSVQNLTATQNGIFNLYAIWDPVVYEINYDLAGGTLLPGASNPRTYTANDEFTLSNPVWKYNNFIGWTGTGLNGPTNIVKVPKGSSGDRGYLANWEIMTYTVKFDSNGGTPVPSQSIKAFYSATESAAPTREHYIFTGWYADRLLTTPFNFKTAIAENITLYAGWNPIMRTISFDLAGGTLNGQTGIITMKCVEGETIRIPGPPTLKGFTFQYWKGSMYHPGDNYVVKDDHTLTAVWKKNLPETGDASQIPLWAAMVLLSLGGLAVLRRRHKRDSIWQR